MRYQLATSTQLDGMTRQLAFLWNAWLRERVLWRDADVGTACREFYLGHPEIWRDSPLRRAFVGHLLLLHQFRLLTPEQMDEVLAAPAAVKGAAKGEDKPVDLPAQATPPVNGEGRDVSSEEATAVAAGEERLEGGPLREEQAVDSEKAAKLDSKKAAPMELEKAAKLDSKKPVPMEAEQAAELDSNKATPMDLEQAAELESRKDAPMNTGQATPLDSNKATLMDLEQATEQLELELTMPADSEQADSELAAPMDSEQSVPLTTEQAVSADSKKAAPAGGKKLAQPAAGGDQEPGPGQPEAVQETQVADEPQASSKALEPQASLWKKHRKTLKPLSPVAEAPRPPAA